jgi:predicted helicase
MKQKAFAFIDLQGDIDSFLSASSKKNFVRIIIVATAELGSNAAEAVKDQKPPVHVIGLADLENSQIDWDCYDNTKKIKLKPAKQLRQHQTGETPCFFQ